MSTDFLPRRDESLLTWSKDFAVYVAANTVAVGLLPTQSSDLQDRVDLFQATLANALNAQTRGGSVIHAKDEARAAMVELIRQLVRIIQAHPGVTDQMRYNMGITIPKQREPIPAPVEIPNVDILEVINRMVKVRAHDGTGSRRGKPKGVKEAIFFTAQGGSVPPADPADWTYQGATGKTTAEIYVPGTAATTLWITAQWKNSAGTGVGCTPISVNIAAGAVMPEKMKIAA